MQRNGTTSVGEFFSQHGYKVAVWSISRKNKWSFKWFRGDFESIFNSYDFKKHQVFEDDPWWYPEFYKVLYHRFPKAKFILIYRDSDKWFQSMLNHSNGKTLGNTKVHSKVYRREAEFNTYFDEEFRLNYDEFEIDNLFELKGHEEHYKSIYELRNLEIIEFFKRESPNSLFVSNLENPNLWIELAKFFKISIPQHYKVHANKSN